jgi:hypothetical protein
MIVAGVYSHKGGLEVMKAQYPAELSEIYRVIETIDAAEHKRKVSEEKRSKGALFYSPRGLNKAFKEGFTSLGWKPARTFCEYPTEYYASGYTPRPRKKGERRPKREMDFVKNKVGIEVQLGKYSFMVYNVSAKMTIFHRLEFIDIGVEIVPIKELAKEMSSGVSFFEQLVWDLEHREAADIDIPVLVLGLAVAPVEDSP